LIPVPMRRRHRSLREHRQSEIGARINAVSQSPVAARIAIQPTRGPNL
jgi:hypothetical protein